MKLRFILYALKNIYVKLGKFRSIKLKGKSKVVPVFFLSEHHAMKAYWGSGDTAPRSLDLGTRWR